MFIFDIRVLTAKQKQRKRFNAKQRYNESKTSRNIEKSRKRHRHENMSEEQINQHRSINLIQNMSEAKVSYCLLYSNVIIYI